ncbi:hypothetical protein PCE1_001495 [Barthelona sp. PCE]
MFSIADNNTFLVRGEENSSSLQYFYGKNDESSQSFITETFPGLDMFAISPCGNFFAVTQEKEVSLYANDLTNKLYTVSASRKVSFLYFLPTSDSEYRLVFAEVTGAIFLLSDRLPTNMRLASDTEWTRSVQFPENVPIGFIGAHFRGVSDCCAYEDFFFSVDQDLMLKLVKMSEPHRILNLFRLDSRSPPLKCVIISHNCFCVATAEEIVFYGTENTAESRFDHETEEIMGLRSLSNSVQVIITKQGLVHFNRESGVLQRIDIEGEVLYVESKSNYVMIENDGVKSIHRLTEAGVELVRDVIIPK